LRLYARSKPSFTHCLLFVFAYLPVSWAGGSTAFFLFLLTCLLAGLVGLGRVPVQAASSSIVISQVYGGGGNSGATYQNDFVELFNLGSTTISLTGWSIQYASATGTSWNVANLSGSILAGQYYLVQLGSNGAIGSVLPTADATGTTNLNATDGKIALLNTTVALTGTGCPFTANIIDFIGYGTTANCSEMANAPAPSATSSDIRSNTCSDTDDNGTDFSTSNPNPRNTSILPVACLRVVDVTSTVVDSPPSYVTGNIIPITIKFSNNVNVDTTGGTPYLLLETGVTDEKAIYANGTGTSTLIFNYTVIAGDASGDLEYVSTNSLILNGGTIIGAVGNADLTLPIPSTTCPATPCSLGANKNIVIDNQLFPTVTVNQASTQSDPSGIFPINFAVVFSEPVDVSTFTTTDINQTGTATVVNWSIMDSGDHLNFMLSATGATGSGTIVPFIAANQVNDPVGNGNSASTSSDNVVTYENIPPDVTITRAPGQPTTASGVPVNFAVAFSEPINASTFTTGDITQSGTIASGLITWNIVDSGDHTNFTLSAIAVAGNGIIKPTITASRVADIAGNGNNPSGNVGTNDEVDFQDTVAPTVTVNQAVGQPDPTGFFPVKFAVVFSEPIVASIFTSSDITQNGTATGVTWTITDSGDHMNFTLSATAATGSGTLQPSIAANRITDLVGNNNSASTSTDNSVVYDITRPTVTVNQATGQADPTTTLPINFTVVFSEPIEVTTFTTADIIQAGTASGIVWAITDSGDHKTFTLSAITMTKNGTLVPAIGVNRVTDLAGNSNFASTSTDNSVTCTAIVPTPTRTPTATPTATPTLGVFISEVAWMGTKASTSDEWIELYNSGPVDVDLSNWTLTSTDGSININFLSTDPNHIIKSHEFFILARSGTFTDVVIDKTITAAFNDSGKSLQLRNNLGILIDTANSNGGSWPAGVLATSTKPYGTMERHNGTALDMDVNWYTFAGTPTTHDRNGNLVYGTPGYANWAISVTATPSPLPTATRKPTPTRTPVPPPPPPLIAINEFVPRPGHDWNNDGEINTGDEYIEIINHGVIPVNLGGYLLDDEANVGSTPFSLPATTLQPGARIVFYGSQTGLLLSDGGDGVRLLKSGGQLVDAYNYAVAKYPDQSFCRLPDNGGLDDWNDGGCLPTPGLPNKPGTGLPSEGGEFDSLCPIADALPEDFVLAECPSIGNIWSRYYWDQDGWLNEIFIPNQESQWETFVE